MLLVFASIDAQYTTIEISQSFLTNVKNWLILADFYNFWYYMFVFYVLQFFTINQIRNALIQRRLLFRTVELIINFYILELIIAISSRKSKRAKLRIYFTMYVNTSRIFNTFYTRFVVWKVYWSLFYYSLVNDR